MAFPFAAGQRASARARLWTKMRTLGSGLIPKRAHSVRRKPLAQAMAARQMPRAGRVLFEPLEPRLLLSAELFYLDSGNTDTDLTLNFDETASEYQLLTSADVLVSSADAADAAIDGIINVTGTTGDDSLTLDLDSLSAETINFLGTGNDTLHGPDADSEWNLTGAGSGTLANSTAGVTFTGIERLVGGAENDNFNIEALGSVSNGVDGGAGDDALIADDVDNVWSLTGSDAGTLNGLAFLRIENLIGGTGDDSFVFDDGATITGVIEAGADDDDDLDGEVEPEVDTIDYSAYTTAVIVDLGNGLGDGDRQPRQYRQLRRRLIVERRDRGPGGRGCVLECDRSG